ncbi:MAG: hypothetical protein K8W52_47275 [Deltaproteobacteria bacterium]|nr:hypothetical protein [Deltaproteobacteria bacterium]
MKHTFASRSSLLVAAVAVALTGRAAVAQPTDADARMTAGLDAYNAADYPTAIAAFREAYAIDARPAALFAVAQAERMAGDCAGALVDYDRFLASGPSERAAAAARAQRAVCATAVPAEPQGSVVGAPVASTTVITLAPPPAPHRSPWWRDPLSDGLVLGATAAAATGLGFTLAARSAIKDGDNAPTYEAHQAAIDRLGRDRVIAAVAWSSAAVLVGASVWRIARRPERREASVALVPGPGAGLAIAGGF